MQQPVSVSQEHPQSWSLFFPDQSLTTMGSSVAKLDSVAVSKADCPLHQIGANAESSKVELGRRF